MKIIDPKTGKRIINTDPSTLKELKKNDPVKRFAEKDFEQIEHSPMDPPEAYTALEKNQAKDNLPELIQLFNKEHQMALEKIDSFESSLKQFKEQSYKFDKKINENFGSFFEFFDKNLLIHNIKEEKILFPLLHKRLIESGEHSKTPNPRTGIDLLEDDHIKFIQLGSLTFNLLGLATRIQDETSRLLIFDVAYNNGRELVELLRLHIFREEQTIFPSAAKLLTREEFEEMINKLEKLSV